MTLPDHNYTITPLLFNKNKIYEIESGEFSNNFPVVYIIYDLKLKSAYVGETINVVQRMQTHLNNPDKKKLKYLIIISSPYFNKSSTLDIESYLIKYLPPGSNLSLINGNAGLIGHDYYQKKSYYAIFNNIWKNLKLKNIVTSDILDIDNSDLFKFSPYKSLSQDQNKAILHYLNVLLNNDESTIFVDGSAGTGKTILAVYLVKLLLTDVDIEDYNQKDPETISAIKKVKEIRDSSEKLSIALVVPMTSLRKTLKKVFKNIRGLFANMVIGPSDVFKKKYDILIVDEAHRLHRRFGITNYGAFDKNNEILELGNSGDELDWINRNSKHQLYFYDEYQSIRPSDIPREKFINLKSNNNTIKLTSQMRVKGGTGYIDFVHRLLHPESECSPDYFDDEIYDLKLFSSFTELREALKIKEKEHGLCRMMAGYSWKWVSKKSNEPDAIIEEIELYWNRVPSDWINSTTSMNEIGCIHTTQGYDLNYAGIILGKDIIFHDETNSIDIVRENYFDKKGRVGINDLSILKAYIINIYKTLMLRGIHGAYIYCCDKKLHKYFSNFMKTV
jgi:uncharacterized protein